MHNVVISCHLSCHLSANRSNCIIGSSLNAKSFCESPVRNVVLENRAIKVISLACWWWVDEQSRKPITFQRKRSLLALCARNSRECGLAYDCKRGAKFPAKTFLSLSIDPQLRPQSEIAGGYVQQGGFFLFSFETSQVQTGMAKSFLCSLEENRSPYSVSWSVHLSASSAVPPPHSLPGDFAKEFGGAKPLPCSWKPPKKGLISLDLVNLTFYVTLTLTLLIVVFFNLSVISVDMKWKSYLFDPSFQ